MVSEDFFCRKGINVSRETFEALRLYGETLLKWQSSFNLISNGTISSFEERHFLDSAQLVKYIPPSVKALADLGSGAGFPGMVLALITKIPTFLIESNQKKASFLREVGRITQAPVTIVSERIEKLSPLNVDLITARALAPLSLLLEYSSNHLKAEGMCLFLKGKNCDIEREEARKKWSFLEKKYPSITDCTGAILGIKEIKRMA